ncbi:MAG: hypothetical protein NC409_13590 [Clostridium sp.]|nr:hypothetical protein [Clostridium sp.]
MSREILKDLIDMISDNDIETIFRILIRFVPEDEPLPDEIRAIEEANRSIIKEGTVPHDAIEWD